MRIWLKQNVQAEPVHSRTLALPEHFVSIVVLCVALQLKQNAQAGPVLSSLGLSRPCLVTLFHPDSLHRIKQSDQAEPEADRGMSSGSARTFCFYCCLLMRT